MEGDWGTTGYHSASAEADYSTAGPGGDTGYQPSGGEQHQTHEQQEYNQEAQEQHPENEPSGGGPDGSTVGSEEANRQGGPGAPPPPYQQGRYQGQQNNPNFATRPPPPAYNPHPGPPTNNPYPPPRPNPNVYPPQNPGPPPVHPPPVFQQQRYNGQHVPPSRPTIQATSGFPSSSPILQPVIRPDIGPPEPWASELFGFLQDCYGCPLVILAPCITFGQIAEIVDTGYNRCQTAGIIYAMAFFLGIPCLYSYTYRTKMRHRFNLREDPLDDFCTHFWCEWCALAQEYREIRYRGIDPSMGYDMQRDAIQRAMEAPVPPRMQNPPQNVYPPQDGSTLPPHKAI